MGRWAQRRMRSSIGPGPTAPTPNAVTLLAVSNDGTDWILHFSGPIVTDTGVAPDAAFDVSGNAVLSVSPGAGALCSLTDDGGLYTAGQPWEITGQPNWLVTTLAGPSSGTTT